jgi:hypothetical protein
MSLSGISGNPTTVGVQNQYQRVQDPFRKYCHEPQIGNPDAQTDSVSLSQSFKSQLNAGGPVGQMINNIGQALQAGDLSAAQDSLDTLSNVGPCAAPKGSHVPPMAAKLSQGLTVLGTALKSGDLSAAQQAYSAVQQVWKQVSGDSTTVGDTTPTVSSGISVRL